MKAVVLGGTSGMGREVARRLSERGDSVFLRGMNEENLGRSATDLRARHPRQEEVRRGLCNLEQPEGFASA